MGVKTEKVQNIIYQDEKQFDENSVIVEPNINETKYNIYENIKSKLTMEYSYKQKNFQNKIKCVKYNEIVDKIKPYLNEDNNKNYEII